jgi:hypothetical protein
LVVKNGSNARSSTSFDMPGPLSLKRSLTCRPDRTAGLAVRASGIPSTLAVSMVSAPTPGSASRALMARLSSTCSS